MYRIPLRNPENGVLYEHFNLAWVPPPGPMSGARPPLTIYQTAYQAVPLPGLYHPIRSVIVHIYLDDLYNPNGPFARIDLILPAQGQEYHDPRNRGRPRIHIYCAPPALTRLPELEPPNRSRSRNLRIRVRGRGYVPPSRDVGTGTSFPRGESPESESEIRISDAPFPGVFSE